MTPTSRSLAYLREKGYQVCVVEKWIPRANVRRDAFGFGDLLVCGDEGIALVQVTSASNMAAREKKIHSLPEAAKWRTAGGEIWLHGWSKKGKRGERKRWTLTERTMVRNVNEGEKFYTQEEVEAIALKARLDEAELISEARFERAGREIAFVEWLKQRIAKLSAEMRSMNGGEKLWSASDKVTQGELELAQKERLACGHTKAELIEQPHRVMVNLMDEPAKSEPVYVCASCKREVSDNPQR